MGIVLVLAEPLDNAMTVGGALATCERSLSVSTGPHALTGMTAHTRSFI
jgi:hypothetical protein